MSKIPAAAAARLFEEIIGWPYASPGTGDQRGIDCSGAWVRVYGRYGKRVFHGSNTMFRKHCLETGPIHGTGPLLLGMAVFKARPWRDIDHNHGQYGQAPEVKMRMSRGA